MHRWLWLLNLSQDMDVSESSGTPKSSISIGFSIIKHPFWGTPIFGNTHILQNESLTEYSDTVDGRNPALAGMYKTL